MTQLQNWIADECGGPWFVYLTAPERWLFDARDKVRRKTPLKDGERVRLDAANLAVDLYLQGRVELVQRRASGRNEAPVFEYIAIRRKRRAERSNHEQIAWDHWKRCTAKPPKPGKKKRPKPRLEPADA